MRQLLESFMHEHNSFVTLTYAPHNLPDGLSVNKNDVQLFFKRLRAIIAPARVRYFAAAEYGEKNGAPHYHISMFGLSRESYFGNERDYFGGIEAINRAWALGRTNVGEFNRKTAAYVTKYVTKRMSHMRMEAREREFVLMSRMPGLGATAIAQIAETLKKNPLVWDSIHDRYEVPRTLNFGKRKIYLDRYTWNGLLSAIGFTDEVIKKVKQKSAMEASEEMCALLKAALGDSEDVSRETKTFRDIYEGEQHAALEKTYGKHHQYRPRRGKS